MAHSVGVFSRCDANRAIHLLPSELFPGGNCVNLVPSVGTVDNSIAKTDGQRRRRAIEMYKHVSKETFRPSSVPSQVKTPNSDLSCLYIKGHPRRLVQWERQKVFTRLTQMQFPRRLRTPSLRKSEHRP